MGSCRKIQTAGMTVSTANILYNKKKIAICSKLVAQYSAEDTGLQDILQESCFLCVHKPSHLTA